MNEEKMSYEGLTEQDFTFPDLHQPFLPGNRNRYPKFYLGLQNWDYGVKPKTGGISQTGTLSEYSKTFNATELEVTFHELIAADKVEKWKRSVASDDFKFCPQFYKGITHIGKIDTPKIGLTTDYLKRVKGFGDKLGCCYMQLPDNEKYETADGLVKYLQALPEDMVISVELRDSSWFEDKDKLALFADKLNRINKGLVISDTPGRRDAVHQQLTTTTAFIRFYGEGWHEHDLYRISQWKKKIQSWYLQGLETCYFFMHIQNSEGAEDFVSYVREEFRF